MHADANSDRDYYNHSQYSRYLHRIAIRKAICGCFVWSGVNAGNTCGMKESKINKIWIRIWIEHVFNVHIVMALISSMCDTIESFGHKQTVSSIGNTCPFTKWIDAPAPPTSLCKEIHAIRMQEETMSYCRFMWRCGIPKVTTTNYVEIKIRLRLCIAWPFKCNSLAKWWSSFVDEMITERAWIA